MIVHVSYILPLFATLLLVTLRVKRNPNKNFPETHIFRNEPGHEILKCGFCTIRKVEHFVQYLIISYRLVGTGRFALTTFTVCRNHHHWTILVSYHMKQDEHLPCWNKLGTSTGPFFSSVCWNDRVGRFVRSHEVKIVGRKKKLRDTSYYWE